MLPENSIFNLKKIFLILGTACNFNCIYCIEHENKPRCKKVLHPDVIAWLDDLSYKLPEVIKPTIHFYGGEPLLYKEAIHQVIDQFGDKFRYLIVSNGAYLDDKDVEYFNEHGVAFVLSNDGAETSFTRQVDMLKDASFVERFNRLKDRAVDAVWCAVNQDLYQVYDYVQAVSPGTKVWHEELIPTEDTDERLTKMDEAVLLKSFKRMGEEFESTKESYGSREFGRWLKEALGKLKQPAFGNFPNCGSGQRNLSIDTEGNVYLCKNFNEKIGTIKDSYEVLNARAKDKIKALRDANLEGKGCFDCPAFYFCRGGCPFEKPSERQKEKCVLIRTKWQSVVSFIDNKLTIEVKK